MLIVEKMNKRQRQTKIRDWFKGCGTRRENRVRSVPENTEEYVKREENVEE